jgi:multisubunit Na+/H+ antiporter MnhF subunit
MIVVAAALVTAAGLIAIVGFWRLREPVERIVAVDAFAACAVAAAIVAAVGTGEAAFLDVGIGFAAVAFVSTMGWAYALSGDGGTNDDAGPSTASAAAVEREDTTR